MLQLQRPEKLEWPGLVRGGVEGEDIGREGAVVILYIGGRVQCTKCSQNLKNMGRPEGFLTGALQVSLNSFI